MTELLPCPFCQSELISVKMSGDFIEWAVHPRADCILSDYEFDWMTIKDWNTRPSPWRDISTVPIGVDVLVLFSKSRHVEDAIFSEDEENGVTYMLFDGEQLNDYPTHWMPIPEAPKED